MARRATEHLFSGRFTFVKYSLSFRSLTFEVSEYRTLLNWYRLISLLAGTVVHGVFDRVKAPIFCPHRKSLSFTRKLLALVRDY